MPNKSYVEDILALGSDMLGNLVEARHELKSRAKRRVDSVARGLDLVSREEFDAAFAMLAKARDMQESLSDRVAKIEAHLNLSSGEKTVKTKRSSLPIVKTKSKGRARK